MRKSTITAARAFVAALPLACIPLVASSAAASSGPTPATAKAYERLLARFDANRDGILETSELPPRLAQRLGPADADHDGRITPAELHAFGEARRAERFAKADRNGDGKLEPTEVSPLRWERIRVADANGDGAVSLAEIEQAIASGKLHRLSPEETFQWLDPGHTGVIVLRDLPPRLDRRLGRADANHDGKLTLDELRAFRAGHPG